MSRWRSPLRLGIGNTGRWRSSSAARCSTRSFTSRVSGLARTVSSAACSRSGDSGAALACLACRRARFAAVMDGARRSDFDLCVVGSIALQIAAGVAFALAGACGFFFVMAACLRFGAVRSRPSTFCRRTRSASTCCTTRRWCGCSTPCSILRPPPSRRRSSCLAARCCWPLRRPPQSASLVSDLG